MTRNIDATDGNLFKKSVQIAWPAVLQALLVNFYAFNDFFFVGLLGDRAATAALSACFAIIVVHTTLLRVIPTGATTLIAQNFGRGRLDRVAAVLRQALSGEALWSLVITTGGLMLLPWIVGISNATPAVGERISDYLAVIFWSSPLFAVMLVVIGTFRACGNTRIPLVLEIVSVGLNALLNWVLVLGVGPVPSMGITGAAIATVASRGLPGIIGLVLIWRGHLGVDPTVADRSDPSAPSASSTPSEPHSAGLSAWRPGRRDTLHMMRIGLFSSVSGLLYGVVFFILNRMAGELGPAAQGGLGAGVRGIEWIGYAFGDGFSKAAMAVVGQNAGAERFGRARRGALINAGLSAACCQMAGFAFLAFPQTLSAVVTDDPATLGFAATYVGTIGWVMWSIGLEMALYGVMVGIGHTHVTLIVSGGINSARIPIAAALLFGWEHVYAGVSWAMGGAAVAPPPVGGFTAIVWTIAGTTLIKSALLLAYALSDRAFAGATS